MPISFVFHVYLGYQINYQQYHERNKWFVDFLVLIY